MFLALQFVGNWTRLEFSYPLGFARVYPKYNIKFMEFTDSNDLEIKFYKLFY